LVPMLDQLDHTIEVGREVHLSPAQAFYVADHSIDALGHLADGAQVSAISTIGTLQPIERQQERAAVGGEPDLSSPRPNGSV